MTRKSTPRIAYSAPKRITGVKRRKSSGTVKMLPRGRVPKVRRVARQYVTTGRMAGNFKRVKWKRGSQYAKKGFMMRTEKGGVIEQDKCVYVGHTSGAPDKILRVLFHCIIRKIYALASTQMKTFKEEIFNDDSTTTETVTRFDLVWIDGDAGDRRVVSIIPAAESTYESVADSLQSAFVTDFQTAHAAAAFSRFRMIELRYVLSAGTTTINKAKLPLSELYFKMNCVSELTLQNRTLANSGVNPEHHDSMLDVENNPVEGYKYRVPGTGFVMKWTNDTTAPSVPFIADSASGVITGDPDDANLTTEEQDLLQRPPTSFAFQRCSRSVKCVLGPGALKRNKLTHTATYHVNKILHGLKEHLLGNANRCFVGKSEMFAFEKMMHTTDATEPDISIGYECNTTYYGLVWFKSPKILMDKDVL